MANGRAQPCNCFGQRVVWYRNTTVGYDSQPVVVKNADCKNGAGRRTLLCQHPGTKGEGVGKTDMRAYRNSTRRKVISRRPARSCGRRSSMPVPCATDRATICATFCTGFPTAESQKRKNQPFCDSCNPWCDTTSYINGARFPAAPLLHQKKQMIGTDIEKCRPPAIDEPATC